MVICKLSIPIMNSNGADGIITNVNCFEIVPLVSIIPVLPFIVICGAFLSVTASNTLIQNSSEWGAVMELIWYGGLLDFLE